MRSGPGSSRIQAANQQLTKNNTSCETPLYKCQQQQQQQFNNQLREVQQAPDKKPGTLLLSKSSQLLLSEQYSPKLKENRFKLKSTIQNLRFKIRATSSSSAGLTRQLRRPACGFGSRELCCAARGNGLHKVDEKITSIKMFKIIQMKRFARERCSYRDCVAQINYHLYHLNLPDKRDKQHCSVLTKRDWLTFFISRYCSCKFALHDYLSPKTRAGFSQDLNVHLLVLHTQHIMVDPPKS